MAAEDHARDVLPTDVGVSVHEVGPPGTAPAEVGGGTPQREHSMAQNAADKAGPPTTPPPSTQQPATSAGAAAASSGGDHAASQLTAHSVSAVPKAEAALPGAAGVSGVDEDKRKKRLVLENMRLQKWRDMLANWETWTGRKANHLKTRCRKGIPDAFRAVVWPLLVHSSRRKAANPDLYAQLLDAPIPEPQQRVMGEIDRDITRTFPRMQLFRQRGGLGQASLLRVLRAYALFNPQVGYCQGMSFLTAFFLSYLSEEDAFWMLLTLCEYEPHRLADIFAPGLPLVNLLQYQLQGLVRQYLPKLAAHFDKHGIHPTMYAAQWMLTIFTYSFPFSVTCRVWDSFLLEGWKVVFRVGLAVLQHHEAALLALDMEGMLMYFPHMHEDLDGDALLAAAFKFSFRRRQLRALRAAFEAEHGPVTSPVQRMTTFEHRTAAVAQAVAEQSPTPLLPAKAKAVSPGPAAQDPALWTPAAAAAEAAKAHPPSTPVMVMSGGQTKLHFSPKGLCLQGD